jgi:hypothetical protein
MENKGKKYKFKKVNTLSEFERKKLLKEKKVLNKNFLILKNILVKLN